MTEDTTSKPAPVTTTGGSWLKPSAVVAVGIASIFMVLAAIILISGIKQMTGSLPVWLGQVVAITIGVGAIIGGDFLYRKRDLKIAGVAIIGVGIIIGLMSVFSLIATSGMFPDLSGAIPNWVENASLMTRYALIMALSIATFGYWQLFKEDGGKWPKRFAYILTTIILFIGAWGLLPTTARDLIGSSTTEFVSRIMIDFFEWFAGLNISFEEMTDQQIIAGLILLIAGIASFITGTLRKTVIAGLVLWSVWVLIPDVKKEHFGENASNLLEVAGKTTATVGGAIADGVNGAGEALGGLVNSEPYQEWPVPNDKIYKLAVNYGSIIAGGKVVRRETINILTNGGILTKVRNQDRYRHNLYTNVVTCVDQEIVRARVNPDWLEENKLSDSVEGLPLLIRHQKGDYDGSTFIFWELAPEPKRIIEKAGYTIVEVTIERFVSPEDFELVLYDDKNETVNHATTGQPLRMLFTDNKDFRIIDECHRQFEIGTRDFRYAR